MNWDLPTADAAFGVFYNRGRMPPDQQSALDVYAHFEDMAEHGHTSAFLNCPPDDPMLDKLEGLVSFDFLPTIPQMAPLDVELAGVNVVFTVNAILVRIITRVGEVVPERCDDRVCIVFTGDRPVVEVEVLSHVECDVSVSVYPERIECLSVERDGKRQREPHRSRIVF